MGVSSHNPTRHYWKIKGIICSTELRLGHAIMLGKISRVISIYGAAEKRAK